MTALALCGVLVQCSGGPAPTVSTPSAAPSAAAYRPEPATVAEVSASELGDSWSSDCPVTPAQLRRVTLTYLGFDAQPHRGELIVNKDLVSGVIAIFERLYRLEYPIEKMRTVVHYAGADDELSMEDNNTSAFNCRRIPGSGNWALHAYGRAIDVNPLLNPMVTGSDYQPKNAAVYLDRHRIEPGLLHPGDPAVRAFTDAGWDWGGYWTSPKDYQHFERN